MQRHREEVLSNGCKLETWNRKSISIGFYPETPAWLISTWLVCGMLEDALVILKVSQIRTEFP